MLDLPLVVVNYRGGSMAFKLSGESMASVCTRELAGYSVVVSLEMFLFVVFKESLRNLSRSAVVLLT